MPPQYLDRSTQARRAWPKQILRSPQPKRGIVDDQHQRKCGEQLEKLRRAIDAAQQHNFDQRADYAHDESGCEDATPEPKCAADMGRKRISGIGPQHI